MNLFCLFVVIVDVVVVLVLTLCFNHVLWSVASVFVMSPTVNNCWGIAVF